MSNIFSEYPDHIIPVALRLLKEVGQAEQSIWVSLRQRSADNGPGFGHLAAQIGFHFLSPFVL
jgi:hypothetical protein